MKYKILPVLISLTFLLCSCSHIKDDEKTTTTTYHTENSTTEFYTETQISNPTLETTTQIQTTAGNYHITETESETVPSVMGVPIPEKKADMYYTDDINNKFIQAVAKKYNISPNGLACIYAVPADDTNQVWQFSSSNRNADTLKYVYMVSADCQTVYRTGGVTGNDGMDITMGILTFQTTKKHIIPLFENELKE